MNLLQWDHMLEECFISCLTKCRISVRQMRWLPGAAGSLHGWETRCGVAAQTFCRRWQFAMAMRAGGASVRTLMDSRISAYSALMRTTCDGTHYTRSGTPLCSATLPLYMRESIISHIALLETFHNPYNL